MVGAAIIGQARDRGIGISSFVALGNRSDVSGNDLLQYWEGDESTDVVCMYIESLGNPRHFSRLARRLTRAKPVVTVKAGRLPTSLASVGHDATEAALLEQTGVIRVPTLSAMLDTARLLTSQPLPAGRRVAIVGNAGGSLAIAADAAIGVRPPAERAGADGTQAALSALATHAVGRARCRRPRAGGQRRRRRAGRRRCSCADPGVDGVLALYAPSLGATPAEVEAALDAAREARPDVPVVACFYGRAAGRRQARSRVFDAVDAAARALGRAAAYAEWLALPEGEPARAARAARGRGAARWSRSTSRPRPTASLDEPATMAVLDAIGLTTLPTEVVSTVEDAQRAAESMGYPVVLKAAGRDRMAKTAAAGFAIDLEGPDALRLAWERMEETMGDAGSCRRSSSRWSVPGSTSPSTVRDHPSVGPVLSLGPGGAASALDTAADLQVLPLSDLDAAAPGRRARASRRSSTTTASRALEGALLAVAALVEEVPGDRRARPQPGHRPRRHRR